MKKKILIVNLIYYKKISSSLSSEAKSCLVDAGVMCSEITVPGVFEIPVIISKNIKKYDGFVALGCVIKGETPHFDFISKSTIDAIMKLSIEYKKPVGNGILTCLNVSQANTRSSTSGSKRGKGIEAAEAVLEVLKSF